MKKEILMSFVVAAMMASCSFDEELTNSGEKFNGNVTLTAEPYTFEDGDTRTTLTNTGSKIAFAWDDDEAIGIFPIAPTTNIQAKQVLKNGSGNSTTSSFDGAGWALLYGNTYAAYYPFNPEMKLESTYKDVPIDMNGQIQNDNNNLDHIGAGYDYMYAVADVPNNGNVNFDFKHVTSIIMLELTMPIEATWKSVTLTMEKTLVNAHSGTFTTTATMNVQDGTITPNIQSPSVTLALNNVTTTASNKKVTLYVAVLPTEISTLSLTATTSGNETYCTSLQGKNIEAGMAYRFTTSFNTVALPSSGDGYENGYAWVDLGLPSKLKWATMNVGATNVIDYGKYYAWGETKGYGEEDRTNVNNYNYTGNYVKTTYILGENTYKWGGNYLIYKWDMTKYCTSSSGGTVDNKTTLDLEDDAATQNWGGAWRMPTHTEMAELLNNCYLVWTSSYNDSGIAGYIVYAAKSLSDKGQAVYEGETPSNIYSLSDSHIFLPFAGYVEGYYFHYVCKGCVYWTSSLNEDNCEQAWYVYFRPDAFAHNTWGRFSSKSIRAVCE